MINVVQEIVDKLRTVYPSAQYDVYTERIEQGFSAPCFSIRQLRADVTPYPSNHTHGLIVSEIIPDPI